MSLNHFAVFVYFEPLFRNLFYKEEPRNIPQIFWEFWIILKIKISIIINMRREKGKNSYFFEGKKKKKKNELSLILFFLQEKILHTKVSLIYHGFSPHL